MSEKFNALLWKPAREGQVNCGLCSHFCLIAEGEGGRCGVRFNEGGVLQSMVLDKVASINLDPVEKKPLFHFLPGSMTLSLGTLGCNMSCLFCQNWGISQVLQEVKSESGHKGGVGEAGAPGVRTREGTLDRRRKIAAQCRQIQVTPGALVYEAQRMKAASISYTYNEPTMFYELMLETARRAKDQGLGNVMVSNGFQSPEALDGLKDLIHAANIDLKSSSDSFYRDLCGARLAPVLENLKRMRSFGWWLEITTLLIPRHNDSDEDLRGVASFIAKELGPDTPWHISAFRPAHKLLAPQPTPVETIQKAIEIGKAEGLQFVYAGNVPGHDSESTRCPGCNAVFAGRHGYRTQSMPFEATENGTCPQCHKNVPGVWSVKQLNRREG